MRLDELCLEQIAAHVNVNPCIDYVPAEYIDQLVASIDVDSIPQLVAAQYITNEQYWRKVCQSRWPMGSVSDHGHSWKRMFSEKCLAEVVADTVSNAHMNALVEWVSVLRAHVVMLQLDRVSRGLDLSVALRDLPLLTSLSMRYGARVSGMGYESSEVGASRDDVHGLVRLVNSLTVLTRLDVSNNAMGDMVGELLAGLANNNTITHLDLSHNLIRGADATAHIANYITRATVLSNVCLRNNPLGEDGGEALLPALASCRLRCLDLKQTFVGDATACNIMRALTPNTTIVSLNMSSCGMLALSHSAMVHLLQRNTTLTHFDVSCNTLRSDHDDDVLAGAIRGNDAGALQSLNLRGTGESDNGVCLVDDVLRGRRAKAQQRQRKLLQQSGYDELLV